MNTFRVLIYNFITSLACRTLNQTKRYVFILFYSVSVYGLLKELNDSEEGKVVLNPRKLRSPKRRQPKNISSTNPELNTKGNTATKINSFDVHKDVNTSSKNVFLASNVITCSTFLYNFNITMLMMSFEDGRNVLDR